MAFKRKYRSRPYRKSRRGKYSRRVGARRFQSRVTKVLMKKAETKFFDIGDENVQLYHNNGTVAGPTATMGSLSLIYNPWADIPQGAQRFQRIGDKIQPRGMALKLWLSNKLDRPNLMYRVMVIRAPKTITNLVTTYNVNPFQVSNLGGTGNTMLQPIDQDKGFKALYDRVYTCQAGVSGTLAATSTNREYHRYVKLWIKRKRSREIQFGDNGIIVNNPLMVWVIAYDSYGTLTTDNIASCSYWSRLYYKDL